MNDKIKPLLPWINIGLIIVVLFLIDYLVTNVLNVRISNRWDYRQVYTIFLPGFEILRYITLEAINWFGGDEQPFIEFIKTASISATGFIIVFILAPWLFVKGLLNSNADNQSFGLTWYFGTIIIILGISISTLYGVRQTIISPKNDRSIESGKLVDQLRTYMTNVAFDASEWWILPEEAGGGNGSFFLSGDEAMTLTELESYDPEHPDFELIIEETPTDSTMILIGSMINQDVVDESKRHITLKITPKNDSLFKFQTTTITP